MSFNYNYLFILFAIFYLSCDGLIQPTGCEFWETECDDGSCAAEEKDCPTPPEDTPISTGNIIITSPNGNNNFASGYSQPITWTANTSISKVKIYYTKGNTLNNIDYNELNDGSYLWNIPSSQTPGTNYKIKICDYNKSDICDESDYNFTIIGGTGEPIMVTFPNGNMSLAGGYSQTITWAETINDTYVSIKLYKNGSLNSTINPSTANDGSYPWTVASTLTADDDYTIKICGTSNNQCDESDNYFSIKPTGLIGTFSVISPNGGEK